MGKTSSALALFEDAATGLEQHRFQIQYAENIVRALIRCLEDLKQFDRAESWHRKWLAAVKERSGPDSSGYVAALMNLGGNLMHQARFAEAEPFLRECLAIRTKQKPDEWSTYNAASMLGESLAGQKKHADAEPLLVQGYEGMWEQKDKIPAGVRTLRLTESLDRIVRLYDAWDKPEKVAVWKTKLDEFKKASETRPTEKPTDKKP